MSPAVHRIYTDKDSASEGPSLRKSGLKCVGDFPWGTHFCQFYSSKNDLLDILVPYFKAGLENNEFCMWVTAEPVGVKDTLAAMHKQVPGFNRYLKSGQIEIIPYSRWYTKGGTFDQNRVLTGWSNKLKKALKAGYDGMRLTGNTFWLEKKDWKSFADYEHAVDSVIGKYRMLALCTYSLEKCGASEILDVAANHEFALIKRGPQWQIFESSARKRTEDTLKENKTMLSLFEEATNFGAWDWDIPANKLSWSNSYYTLCGLDPREVRPTFKNWVQNVYPEDRARMEETIRDLLRKKEKPINMEFRITHPKKGLRWFNAFGKIFYDKLAPVRMAGITIDITERKRSEEERRILSEFFNLIAASRTARDLMRSATAFIQKESGCHAVGIRLREGDEYPYFETRGFSQKFVRMENRLCEYDVKGNLSRDALGNPVLACMCGNVICGRFDPAKVFFTKKGSFWTNCTTELLASTSEKDRQSRTRNRCNGEGYESVALVALRLGKERIGLLQLNDRRKGRFSIETMAVWERLADSLAIAFSKVRIEETVRWNEKRNAIVSDAASQLLTAEDPQLMVDSVARQVMEFLQCQVFFNFMAVPDEDRLRLNAYSGISKKEARRIEWLDSDATVCGCVDRDSKRIIAENITKSKDRRIDLVRGYGMRAYCCHPLFTGKEVIGTILFGTTRRDSFTADEISLMEAVADLVTAAMLRKRNERSLALLHNRLVIAQQASGAGVFDRDIVTGKLDWSPELFRMFGLDPAEVKACPDQWLKRVHPEDRPLVEKWVKAAIKDHVQLDIEYRIVLPDGRERCIHVLGKTAYSDRGKPQRMSGICIDITERKRLERLVSEKLKENQIILDSAPAMIFYKDKKNNIVRVNKAFADMMGMPKEKLEDKSVFALYPKKQAQAFWKDDLEISKSGKAKRGIIEAVETPQGTRFVQTDKIPYRDDHGTVIGIIGFSVDITERLMAETALRESEKRLNRSQAIAHLGSWELDVANNSLSWSDEVYRIFGLKPQEFKATYEAFLEAVHPDDRAAVDAAYSASLRDGKNTYEVEHRIIRSSTGEIRYVREKCEHVRDAAGKVIRSIGMVHDITEQRLAREKINHLASFPQLNPNPVIELNAEGKVIFANLAAIQTLDRLRVKNRIELFFPQDIKQVLNTLASKDSKIKDCTREIQIKGSCFFVALVVMRELQTVRIYALDITERKKAEERMRQMRDELEDKVRIRTSELVMMNKQLLLEIDKRKETETHLHARSVLLKLLNRTADCRAYLDGAAKLVRGWSKCRCVGIRILNEDARIPYESSMNFSEAFRQSESLLSVVDDHCVCTRVVSGKPEPEDKPFMSKAGSFFCADMSNLVSMISRRHEHKFRGICIKNGFRSLAVVPIRLKDKIIGAIHLADPVPGTISMAATEFIEAVSGLIGEGIHKFRLEDKIRKDHAFLEAYFQHSVSPLVFLDKDLNFIRVNKAYADIFGRETSAFYGRNYLDIDPSEENAEIFKQVVRTKQPYTGSERPFIDPGHPEWGVKYWDWTVVPVLDDKSEVFLLVFSLNDATTRKLHEEELAATQKELEQTRRLSDIGTLSATVAHELRNPLAAIGMAAYNIKRKAKDLTLDVHVNNIEKKVKESDQIISNLLFYSRIKPPHYEKVTIADILDECATVVDKYPKKQITIVRMLDPVKDTQIEADPLQMKEVFCNVLDNACDAVGDAAGRIEISGIEKDGSVVISIKDNGSGIDKSYLERIFDPFFTTKAKGTGLGLSVCQQIVHLHHGSITIESEPQKGTAVTVSLPGKV